MPTHTFRVFGRVCAVSLCLATELIAGEVFAQAEAEAESESEEGSEEHDEVSEGDDAPDRVQDGEEQGERSLDIIMPQVLKEQRPIYPYAAEGSARVIVSVVLDAQGKIQDATIFESAGPAFDEAALLCVRAWEFSPARRGDQTLAAKVNVAVFFERPKEAVPAIEDEQEQDTHNHGGREVAHETDSHLSVTVHGERSLRTERRTASDFFVHREVLDAAPHAEGVDTLTALPGLTMGRGEGIAVAHSYNLRGFDAAHGQDIEFHVAGLPINLPSHIHGQGYADLNFLIGEVVDELHISEGVSDPAQGDFAVAGSIDVGLGVDEEHRGLQLRSSYGSFGTYRQGLVWAPKEGERESFGAAQFTMTDGFGENREAKSGSAILQHRFGEGALRYRAVGLVHAARGMHAGVLRKDDIASGRVCYHCVYPDATARAQYAMNQRIMAGLFADYRGKEHSSGSLGFWVSRDAFRSQFNPTGYLQRSRTLAGVAGRGDLFEQSNRTTSMGISGRYRTEAFEPTSWAHGTVEVGADGRYDSIAQVQNLLDAAVRNQTWDERIDAEITGLSLAMWGDLDWQLGKKFNARVGARAAVLSYDVQDRLGNFAPLVRPQDARIDGFRRSALGVAFGPRASLEYKALSFMSFLSSYGEGYRSPQARILEDGENAPFSKVRSADAGVRFRFSDKWIMTGLGYVTHLSDDVAYDATEGTLERVGATLRRGGALHVHARPLPWFLGALSVTYVHATLQDPPLATAEDPTPPYSEGQRLPYVPPIVVRLDTSARHTLIDRAGKHPLVGVLGLGFTYRSGRPMPFGETGDPWTVLDASAGAVWGPVDFRLSGYNLLHLNYASEEYYFTSHWDAASPVTRVPAHHIAAAAPLNIMVTLGVTL